MRLLTAPRAAWVSEIFTESVALFYVFFFSTFGRGGAMILWQRGFCGLTMMDGVVSEGCLFFDLLLNFFRSFRDFGGEL